MKQINIVVGGPAGAGIESVAHSLALAFTRAGLHTLTANEYENVIRGGHSFASVHVAEEPVLSHQLHYELLIAMDRNSIVLHAGEIDTGGVIIYDGEKTKADDLVIPDGVRMVGIPLATLAKEAGLSLAANVVAVGAALALYNRDLSQMKSVLETIFKRKGEEVVAINHKALEAGFAAVTEMGIAKFDVKLEGDGKRRFLMNGNEGIALGCIKAGMKFLAAYPMTPGSSIMTTLAKEARAHDVVVVHAEDEIAAVVMAVGAGYAGIRAATSTSGGGFALMSEATSLAGQLEAPLVIFDAQRPGPSTGLPTRTAQADLRMAMHCGQGDFPRLVMAAGDHADCVQMAAEAFNYAEKYQIPVIFLTEKILADQFRSCDFDIADGIVIDRGKIADAAALGTDFKRFADSPDGVSPRAVPGMAGGQHTATSYEHGEDGKAVEDEERVGMMMEKRWRKLQSLEAELPPPKVYGEGDDLVVVWGATKTPALAAQRLLAEHGIRIRVIQMQYIFPFKKDAITSLLQHRHSLTFIEGNQSGQLESVFAEQLGIRPDHSIRNFYGRPMTGEWIADQLQQCLSKQ